MPPSIVKKDALEALKGKWGKGILIVLAYLLIAICISFFQGIVQVISLIIRMPIVSSILNLAVSILYVPLAFGFLISFIKLKRNEDVKAFGFIKYGLSRFGKSWGIVWHTFLKLIIPISCMALIIIATSIFMAYTASSSLLDTASSAANDYKKAQITEEIEVSKAYDILDSITNTSTDYSSSSSKQETLPLVKAKTAPSTTTNNKADYSWLFSILLILLYIALFVFAVAKSLLYILAHYICYDNPELSSKECVIRSAMLMKGNRGNYILLTLSFLGWIILAALPIYLGFFWLIPYMQVAMVCFYETIVKHSDMSYEEVTIEE